MPKKKKKRRLKKGFKIFLYIFLLAILVFVLHLLNKNKVINLNKYFSPIHNLFSFSKNASSTQDQTSNQNEPASDVLSVFKARLSSQGFTFASSSAPDSIGNIKIYLQGTYNNSGYLYVNTNDNGEYVWITFVSAIDAEPLKTQLKTDLADLDYIDLRFSNKVFYKFNGSQVNLTKSNLSQMNESSNSSEISDSSTSSSSADRNNPFNNELLKEASNSAVQLN